METESDKLRRIKMFIEYPENRLIKNLKKIQEGKDDEITKARLYALTRQERDNADSKFSECISDEKSRPSDCYSDYGRSLGKINDIIENLRSYRKSKSFYLPCLSETLDSDSLFIIKEINKKIKQRVEYGRREELAEKNSIVLTWSNSSKAWYPTGKAKKGETVNLDSNMILVDDTKDKSKLGHITSCLSNYPLYSASFEAIYETKETPIFEGLLLWVERQIQMIEAKKEREKNV